MDTQNKDDSPKRNWQNTTCSGQNNSIWSKREVRRSSGSLLKQFREEKGNALTIDHNFYEETIARIMLFRTLEKQYGAGKNSLGQLRSAVVPYSIPVIHRYAGSVKSNMIFDLAKIWKQEQFEESFLKMSYGLMELMNNLIKKYVLSDDLGEYSKKQELWDTISKSNEIK